ncbi:MAG: hypothetical protein PHO56_04105 [Patescibacteria group bacterium]|nr:hypothetical protein [Patescibacteria group bacterium]
MCNLIIAGPLVPDDQQLKQCVVNFHLPIGGLSMNCDSPEFLRLATDPQYLFEPKNDRQSRPGYIVLPWLVSRPFAPLTVLAEKVGFQAMRQTPPRFIRPLADYFPAYAGYVLLDIFFLWLAARLFWSLFADAEKKISLTVFVFSLFFIANSIFYHYFWSPHTQVFNIFAPVFCVWAAIKAHQGGESLRKNFFLLSFLAGLGVLAYQTFILFFPAVLFGEWLREKKLSRASLLRYLISFILVILPSIIWYYAVIWKTGSYYQHELQTYNYGIWNQAKGFFNIASLFFLGLGEQLKNILSTNLYIFAAGAAAWFYLWRKDAAMRPILSLIAAVFLLFACFFSVLTFYPGRVLPALVWPWLIPAAIFAEKKFSGRAGVWAAIIYLAGWIVWMCLIGIAAR